MAQSTDSFIDLTGDSDDDFTDEGFVAKYFDLKPSIRCACARALVLVCCAMPIANCETLLLPCPLPCPLPCHNDHGVVAVAGRTQDAKRSLTGS